VNGTGDYASAAARPSAAGTYRWTASYSGDANNHPSATTCNDSGESVVVTGPPAATTRAATSASTTGASLNGSVNPHDSQTTYHFDYGPSTSYGSQIPASDADVGSDNLDHPESQTLSGLTPGTTYHFRIVATNSVGATYGADQTFTTVAPASSGGTGTPAGSDSSSGTPGRSTSGSGLAAAPAGTGTPSVGKAKILGTTVTVPVRCAPGGPSCAVQLQVTVTETIRGGRVIAITSRKTTKTTRKVVVLGAARVTLAHGQSKTVRVLLNATGRRLPAKQHPLRAKVTVRKLGATAGPNVSVQTITFKAPVTRHRP
jgi:hypothetical protein